MWAALAYLAATAIGGISAASEAKKNKSLYEELLAKQPKTSETEVTQLDTAPKLEVGAQRERISQSLSDFSVRISEPLAPKSNILTDPRI